VEGAGGRGFWGAFGPLWMFNKIAGRLAAPLVMRLTDPEERSSRGGTKSMVALGHGFEGTGPWL